jgi:hypothetical protein
MGLVVKYQKEKEHGHFYHYPRNWRSLSAKVGGVGRERGPFACGLGMVESVVVVVVSVFV